MCAIDDGWAQESGSRGLPPANQPRRESKHGGLVMSFTTRIFLARLFVSSSLFSTSLDIAGNERLVRAEAAGVTTYLSAGVMSVDWVHESSERDARS